MEQYQIVKAMLDNNPAGKTVEDIAKLFGRSASYIYSWGEDPGLKGNSIPSKYIVPFSRFIEDDRLIEFYVYQLGKKIIPLKRESLTKSKRSYFERLIKIFAIVNEMSQLLILENNIARYDESRINELIDQVQQELDQFKMKLFTVNINHHEHYFNRTG